MLALPILLALALAVAAAIIDLRTGKIPNWLTAPFAAAGLAIAAARGLDALLLSVAGLAIGVCLWFLGALGGRLMGGGDVKFLAAVGALAGPKFLLVALIAGMLAGGVIALIYALQRGKVLASLRHLATWAWAKVHLRFDTGIADGPGGHIPYGLALAYGVAIAALIV